MAVALPKFSNLIKRMNQLVGAGGLDEFTIASIQADAKKLANAGQYTDSQQILGILASLLGNEDEVKRRFESAIKNGGDEPDTLFNYLVSLSNIYVYKDAIALADRIIDCYRDDVESLRKLLEVYTFAYRFDKSDEILGKLLALGIPEDDKHLSRVLSGVVEKQELVDKAGTTWEDVCERIRCAYSVVRSFNLSAPVVNESVCMDVVLLEFVVDADIDTLHNIENAINDKLASLPYTPADQILAFSCVNKESAAHGA